MNEPVTWAIEDLQNVMSPKFKDMHKDINSSTWKQFPVPLYTHPMRELTEDEIKEVADSVCHTWKKNGVGELYMTDFAKAIIKASRGEK